VVQCGAVWCSVVQCGAVWCSVVQCGAMWCSGTWAFGCATGKGVIRRIQMCDFDALIRVARRAHKYDMTHAYVCDTTVSCV